MIPLDEPDYLPTAEDATADLIARLVHDAHEATSELIRLRNDPEAARFVAMELDDLWKVKTQLDLLLSEIATPRLRVVR